MKCYTIIEKVHPMKGTAGKGWAAWRMSFLGNDGCLYSWLHYKRQGLPPVLRPGQIVEATISDSSIFAGVTQHRISNPRISTPPPATEWEAYVAEATGQASPEVEPERMTEEQMWEYYYDDSEEQAAMAAAYHHHKNRN